MNYERINWQNGAEGRTPINNANLNKMDAAIEYLFENGGGGGGGSLPSGVVVDYEGTEVPVGYEEVTETTYSTDEIDTNKTWIDGKNVYRKVIQGTLSNTPNTWQVADNITNLATIVHFEGFFKGSSNIYTIPFAYNDEDIMITCDTKNGDISILHNYAGANNMGFHIILEYTKTN
jgi:hypothetical protein